MKAIIFYIALLLLMTSDCLFGQSCLQNGGFDNACSSTIGSCPTWTDGCGDGWVRSHGTPQMASYTYTRKEFEIVTAYYAQMWSQSSSSGEGMFTPYTFQAHHTYDVTLYVSTTNANGSILVYAANGLSQSPIIGCGDPIPNISSKQLIGQYPGFTNGWITISFTFTPDVDYSQIWIYPLSSTGVQYDLGVKSVSVCPACDGEIIYNTGVVPSGISKSGTISAGSTAGSGGSGTVTVSSTDVIQLIATNLIRLLPEFHAVVTSGSFDAVVSNCGSPGRIITNDSVPPPLTPSPDLQGNQSARAATNIANKEKATNLNEETQKLTIYPSVSTGLVNITGNPHDLENVELIVFDQLGRKVLQVPKVTYSGKATINLGNLNNGVYILQLKQSTKTISRKIIVQK